MKKDLIIVKQLPEIVEKLTELEVSIKDEISQVLSMEINLETVKEAKKLRAKLNKDNTYWETKRKEVKNQIMAPYNDFESIYNKCVFSQYKDADNKLKSRIKYVEDEIKNEKIEEVKDYFDKLCESLNINFVKFEQSGIKVSLNSTVVSLKKQVKSFLEKIRDEIKIISSLKYSDEIMVEYKKTLNLSSIEIVNNRKLELEKEKASKCDSAPKVQDKVLEVKEGLSAPTVDEEITVTFSVTSSKEKLIKLREFMKNGGYKYE